MHSMDVNHLIKINLPDSVETIENYGFYECASLKEIVLPSSLKHVNSFLFFGCSSLTEIRIPDSVIYIKRYSFANCTSLKFIELTNHLKSINEAAFKGCISLEEINLPLNLATLDHRAFEGCVKLKNIGYLGVDEKDKMNCYFGEYVFNNCSSLKEVTLSKHFVMDTVLVGFFKNCSSLTSFDLDGCFAICENSFRGCSSLNSIVIPDTVIGKKINLNIFYEIFKLIQFS